MATSRNCDDDELSWELGGFGAAGQGGTKGDDSEVLFTPLQTASVEVSTRSPLPCLLTTLGTAATHTLPLLPIMCTQWTSAGTKALAGAKALSADVLVVALEGPGACFLNAACTAKGGDLATVSVAIQASTASAGASAGAGGGAGAGAGAGGASAGAGGSVAAAKPVDDIVTGAVLTVQELAAGSSTVLLAVGTQAVSREAAPAVAAALLGAVSAKRYTCQRRHNTAPPCFLTPPPACALQHPRPGCSHCCPKRAARCHICHISATSTKD